MSDYKKLAFCLETFGCQNNSFVKELFSIYLDVGLWII